MMPTYSFAMVVDGGTADMPNVAAMSDFSPRRVDDGVLLAARRTADTYAHALTTALEEIDAGASLRVLRVEHDGLATLDDIASRMGRPAAELRALGVEELTAVPTATVKAHPGGERWSLWDLAHWFDKRTGDSALIDALQREVAVTEAVNLALALRTHLLALAEDDQRTLARWLASQVG